MQIYNGKYTSKPENSFVVFIFGMRINNFFYIWLWIPFFITLLRMVSRLKKFRDSGMMNAHLFFSSSGIGVMQYWESFDKLEEFALDNYDRHLPNNNDCCTHHICTHFMHARDQKTVSCKATPSCFFKSASTN